MKRPALLRVLRHQISRNVIALSWVQIATFIVPLVTIPYVSRVLGPSMFGLVLFAQGFSLFLTLVVDWGFTPYGTRAIAADRHDPEALAGTVAQIRSAQLLMAAATAPVALIALFVVPKFHAHPAFLALSWIAGVGSALAPIWYFVGIERVRRVALLQLGLRVAGAALTFVLVQGPRDGWIVLALFTASSVAMWTWADVMLYRRVPFRLRRVRTAASAVRDAGRLFVGTVGQSLFSSFNVVLLGLFVSSAQVAHFGAGERIVRSSEQMLGPIGTAVYPRLAYLQASGQAARARRLIMIALVVVGGIGAGLAAVFAIFAPTWIHLIFGPRFVHASVPLLRVLVLLIPSNIIGGVAAVWLMTLHQDRTLIRIVVGAGVLNVVLGSSLAPWLGPMGMAISVVTAQFVAAGAALICVNRLGDEDTALFVRHRGAKRTVETPQPEPRTG